MNENEALMVLNAVPGLGAARIQKLLDYYGSPKKILSLNPSVLKADGLIPPGVVDAITDFPRNEFLLEERLLMKEQQVRVVTVLDGDYPLQLKAIADPPPVLYVRGNFDFSTSINVAIVGSRRASVYGCNASEKFACQLAELGFTVVSGLARGIDTAAHRGALKANGLTVAVLGCGLSHIYPPENVELMARVSEKGAVISEFPMKTPPLPYNFPRRNRVISGLSFGVVVVEAAAKSGALITADFALEQGREVFAIPGNIDRPNAGGVHNLIKEGAVLVASVDDILNEINGQFSLLAKAEADKEHDVPKRKADFLDAELSEKEKFVYDRLGTQPMHIDDLSNICGFTTADLGVVLLQLEIKKLVKQLPGKMFVR